MRPVYITLIFLFTACIESVDLSENRRVDILVVEGGITTEFGPHLVKLTRSAKYGSIFDGTIEYELGAKVFVRDDLGRTFRLKELGKGEYVTPNNFQGEIGHAYTLLIETTVGEVYQSIPEEIVPVPEIDSVSIEYEVIENYQASPSPGVHILVQYIDDPDRSNYYKWEFDGTHRLETHPELFWPRGSPVRVPKECCEICYKTETNNFISVSSDRLYNGNMHETSIGFIVDDGMRFSEKYVLRLKQLSISREAYFYYDLLINQLSITGDIFDPPPATIRGNIISVTNPEKEAIGFFKASDIRRTNFTIWASDLPELQQIPIVPDDCQEVRGATLATPEFW